MISLQPELMDVDVLSTTCQEESSKFFRDEERDDRFCYELFRRALKLRNQHAWGALWNNYRNLVSGWLRKSSGFDSMTLTMDELITLSFERFWYAMSDPASFDRFASLPSLLQYLRTCCASTITDHLRRHTRERFLTDIDDAYYLASNEKPEHQLIEHEEQQRFWRKIQGLLNDDQEEALIQSYFLLGLKPRQIHKKYSHLFPDIQDVYRVKRNIMNRFRRDNDLKDFWQT
ncbi:MAG: sigma-70 family RNA polymerase sigma factor [Ardenticatenales bacterium]|nr:sigma-70 family RNA polymerase sigma factor [Ardenticatenales bacterium]